MNSADELNITKKIAEYLTDPTLVQMQLKQFSNDPSTRLTTTWNPLSLSEGLPGLLVLFATLNNLFPDENWDQISHAYVLKIKEIIEQELLSDLSLFNGWTGCCFAIQAASQKKTRYQKLLSKMNEYLVFHVQNQFFVPLSEKIDLNRPARAEHYDLISGIIGVGTYALQNLDDPTLHALLIEILNICVALSKPIFIDKYTLPGWYIPAHYQFTEQDKKLYPKGNFNLGMAHGASGLLAFLSLAYLQNINVDGQVEAIKRISTWIQSQKNTNNNQIYWVDRISFETETGLSPKTPSHFTMDAWCYGTVGVSRSLYLAGKALNKNELQEQATKAFISALDRIHSDHENVNPTVCHGIAGLLTISKLMARDTQSFEIKEGVDLLQERLIRLYNPEHLFGFKNHEPIGNEFILNDMTARKRIVEKDNVGLLTGVSGILLSLLPLASNHNYWTYPFLIDGDI